MRAAVLKAWGSPLVVETVPDPTPGTGEVVVDVVATGVLGYAREVLSGARQYLLRLPVVPGLIAIGRLRALGPDATRLAVGDWVFCDPTLRSRDDALTPDIFLQGWSAGGERALKLQDCWGQGAWAEQLKTPTENVFAIGPIAPPDAARWCALGAMLVPYGGLLAAGLQAGETLLVNGATGGFGGAAVAVALAMGAGRVIATGRSDQRLADLVRRYGPRVRAARFSGDEGEDRATMIAAAAGPIDCVIDLLPPAADPTWVRAAIMTLRPSGRAVLMGGVGWQGGGFELPYRWLMRNGVTIRGQWMYPRDAVPRLIALVRSGLLSLDPYQITAFDLEDVNAAVEHAATHAGPFEKTIIQFSECGAWAS